MSISFPSFTFPVATSLCCALAKNAGPGSIAHEWFHAFDHYTACKCFRGTPAGMFASTAWLADANPIAHPLNQLLTHCFKAVLLQPMGDQPRDLFQSSVQMGNKLGQLYYSKTRRALRTRL